MRADRRFFAFYVLPTLLILLLAVFPLVAGLETLFFRDVFNTHLQMKWWQAEAMSEGYLPLIDPYRSGGQAHVGNPNTVGLYPDNLLYLVAPFLWSFNAHFWLHWLLAPIGCYWLARELGLDPPGAWASGVFYAASGYLLSNLNLYNLIAGVVLIPFLAASVLALADRQRRRRWRLACVAVLWSLLLLAGDPMTAVVGLALALSTLLITRPALRDLGSVSIAIAIGFVLAAPQLVEFVRILELSFRGHWGYSEAGAMMASWHPTRLIEWFVPLAFGPPDLSFWGQPVHSGTQPLIYSVFPGLLVLLCFGVGAVLGSFRSRAWALAMIVVGLFAALGAHNPIVSWLAQFSGSNLLRLPIKFWPLVAIPMVFLAGSGFGRLTSEAGMRWLRRFGLAFGLGYLLVWVFLTSSPETVEKFVKSIMVATYQEGPMPGIVRANWARGCLQGAGLALTIALTTLMRPAIFVRLSPLLLILHLSVQLSYLRPLYRSDEVSAYAETPAPLAAVPADSIVVHGSSGKLFGKVPVPVNEYRSPDTRWMQRQFHQEAYPYVGMMFRRQYEFDLSPEGLDSFLTRAATEALPLMSDASRVRLLEASGVDRLLMKRPLEDVPSAKLLGSYSTLGDDLLVYQLQGATPAAFFAGDIVFSDHLTDALTRITSEDFDPLRQVVIAGRGEAGDGRPGSVEALVENGRSEVESWRWRVRAEGRGALVIQKTYLPLYRVEVDGEPASVLAANMHRMAVRLGPGEHTVRLWVDRRPFRISLAVALLTLAGLIAYSLGIPFGRRARLTHQATP